MKKNKEDILAKIIILRYLILPKQLITFDYGMDRDIIDFDKYYKTNIDRCINSVDLFIEKIKTIKIDIIGEIELSEIAITFFKSIPFIDDEEFNDSYNPFLADYNSSHLFSYFQNTSHFNSTTLDVEFDEAGIWFIKDYKNYYKWISQKSYNSLLELIIDFKKNLEKYKEIMKKNN